MGNPINKTMAKVSEKMKSVKTPTPEELAKKYNVGLDVVLSQVEIGAEHEEEHTKDKALAMEIALDHLGEDLWYYEKLNSGAEDSGISESMDKPAEYTWLKKDPKEWRASFQVPGDGGETLTYDILILSLDKKEQKALGTNDVCAKKLYFTMRSARQATTLNTVGGVRKSVLMVFATVYAALKDFSKTNSNSPVYFWAKAGEPKRVALYKTFANRLKSEGRCVNILDDALDGIEVFCLLPKGAQISEEYATRLKKSLVFANPTPKELLSLVREEQDTNRHAMNKYVRWLADNATKTLYAFPWKLLHNDVADSFDLNIVKTPRGVGCVLKNGLISNHEDGTLYDSVPAWAKAKFFSAEDELEESIDKEPKKVPPSVSDTAGEKLTATMTPPRPKNRSK